MFSYKHFKRVLDCVISVVALCVLSPLLLVVVLLVACSSKGPLFYRQVRVGCLQKEFELLKFRTMKVDHTRDVNEALDPLDPEITTIGKYLRRYKIDELPQLVNVLVGEMSLVGPRPPLPSLLDDMKDSDKKRFDVLPGLTGLAQTNGNIHISWQQRFKYDLEYAQNMSFILDTKILFKTILIVIFGEEKFVNRSRKR